MLTLDRPVKKGREMKKRMADRVFYVKSKNPLLGFKIGSLS